MLNLHIKTCHRPRGNKFLIKQNQIAEQLTTLHCLSSSCGHQKVASIKDLKIHITKYHTDKKQEVICIFRGCRFKTQNTSTFYSHISKNHRLQLVNDLKSDIVMVKDLQDVQDDMCELHTSKVSVSTEGIESVGPTGEHIFDNVEQDSLVNYEDVQMEDDELFIRSLAITYNSWANVNHIPHCTVNQIVAEIFKSYHLGIEHVKRNIRTVLVKEGVDSGFVNNLLEKMEEDPFDKARQELENERKRENYLLSSFSNVQPQTIKLSEVGLGAKSDTMQ